MPDGLQLEVYPDPADLAALGHALEQLERKLNWNAAGAVQFGANRVTMSLAAASKQGKKSRDIIANPNRTGRGRSAKGAQFAIIVRRQGKTQVLLPTNQRRDPRRTIKRRGMAKAVNKILKGMVAGRAASGGGSSIRGVAKWAHVRKDLKGREPQIEITNKLTYLNAAYPGIEATAVRKGTSAIYQFLERKTGEDLRAF